MSNQTCSIHSGAVLAVCLFNGCNQHFLCLKCYKGHPDHHEPFVKEVSDLIEDKDWIKPYEEERDRLIIQQKDISSQKNKIFSESEILLKNMIEHIIQNLEKKKDSLREELRKLIFIKRDENLDHLPPSFDESIQRLQSLNFQEGSIYEKVGRIKEFNEGLLPGAKKLIELTEGRLKRSLLDRANIDAYKKEIVEIIESINLDRLITGNRFESLKVSGSPLKEENERIKQALIKEREAFEENKKQNIDLSQNLARLKAESEQFTKAKDLLQLDLKALTRELTAVKGLNEQLTKENKALVDQLKGLNKEKVDSPVKIVPLENPKNSIPNVVQNLKNPANVSSLWTWDPNQKGSKLILTNGNLKVVRYDTTRTYSATVGSVLMSDENYKWEIEVTSGNLTHNWIAFGIIEASFVKNFDDFPFAEGVGFSTYGQFYKTTKVGNLSEYDNKTYLCDLDLVNGIFTVSFQGVAICKTLNLKGKTFYPYIVLFREYNTAVLKVIK